MEDLEIFFGSDQPTTCPHCGNRTNITVESERLQFHQCPTINCGFEFILDEDGEEALQDTDGD